MALRFTAFISLVTILFFTFGVERVRACSCATQEREAAFEAAVSVFEGRVTGIDHPQGSPVVVTLDVVRTWKGADGETFTLRTQEQSAACGYAFETGRSYLVYTYQSDDDSEWTGLCSRTSPVDSEQAAADIDAMGAGVTPVDPTGGQEEPPPEPAEVPPVEQRSGGCASCSAAGGEADLMPILFGGLLLGFAFRRFAG
jgi:hypothetical protein